MATKTFYFKDAVPTGATAHRSLQDGGTAPIAAITGTGWVAGTNVVGQSCIQNGGTKVDLLDSQWGTTLQPSSAPSISLGDCWRSENTINGVFANTDWTLNFRILSSTSAYTGRFKLAVRLWRSTDPTGAGATEITSARVVSAATTANLSTVTPTARLITYTPGSTIALTNEYLFVSVGVEITSAGSGVSQDIVFRVSSGATIISPEFTNNFVLSCSAGSYTYSASDILLNTAHSLICDSYNYQISGIDLLLNLAYNLPCDSGTYTYSTGETSFSLAHNLICDAGSYTYSTSDILVNINKFLTCGSGPYAFTGINNSIVLNRGLVCDSGSYVYTGVSALLKTRFNLPCSTGTYIISGNTAAFLNARKLLCNTGIFTYTGLGLLTTINYGMICEVGTYTYESQIAYLQVISSTALPPILYSSIPTNPKIESVVYKQIITTSEDTIPNSETSTTTPILLVNISGPTSTLQDAGTLFKRANDSIVSTDSKIFTINKDISEYILVTDTISAVTALGKVISDSISNYESKVLNISKNITNLVATSEQLNNIVSKSMSDTILIGELVIISPNKSITDIVINYESLSNDINAQEYMLKEDGSFMLREDTYFIVRGSVVPTPSIDSINYIEAISLSVSPVIIDILSASEVLTKTISKGYLEVNNAIENISLLISKLYLDSIVLIDTKSFVIELNSSIDNTYTSEIVSTALTKNILESQLVTDSISAFSFNKLLSDSSYSTDIPITYSLGAQNYSLREDGSYILMEDGFFIVKEAFEPSYSTDNILYTEKLSYSMDRVLMESITSTTDVITKSISRSSSDLYSANDSAKIFDVAKLLTSPVTAAEDISIGMSVTLVSTTTITENITIVITNFLLQEDDVYYILREDDTNFIRES